MATGCKDCWCKPQTGAKLLTVSSKLAEFPATPMIHDFQQLTMAAACHWEDQCIYRTINAFAYKTHGTALQSVHRKFMSKQEFCLQSLNGRRVIPTQHTVNSSDSTSCILACMPACHTCACKAGHVSLVHHSLSFVTLDSHGDRETNGAKTVVRSTLICIRPLNVPERERWQCRAYTILPQIS